MNLKGMQMHQLLAALGACLAAMILAGPAAARPDEDGGISNRPALDEQSVTWYLTDEYRPFMLPESEATAAIVNQRQLELTSDRHEQQVQVIPYLSHGILTASDAARVEAQRSTPDGYQPQLGRSASHAVGPGSSNDRPDGYQPQLGGSELAVVADEGFDWTTTGLMASIVAALFVAIAITITRGSRPGYRSA
jgi:hypothetical protein